MHALWPYLQVFPGLRFADPYPDIFRKWYGEELPPSIQSAAELPDIRRDTEYLLELPRLSLELRPSPSASAVAELPTMFAEAKDRAPRAPIRASLGSRAGRGRALRRAWGPRRTNGILNASGMRSTVAEHPFVRNRWA